MVFSANAGFPDYKIYIFRFFFNYFLYLIQITINIRSRIMSEHSIKIVWKLQGDNFDYESYNRDHRIEFDGKNSICASAAPEFHGNPSCVNPEQAFAASIASCHMLTFLAIASKRGFVVKSYEDNASGKLGKNSAGKTAITLINLRPSVIFAKDRTPSRDVFDSMQEQAHKNCFIANSVASCVKILIEAEFRME